MTNIKVVTPGDFAMILLFSLIAGLYAVFVVTPAPVAENFGICLPSPGVWPCSDLWLRTLNLISIFVMAAGVFFTNRNFGVIHTSQPLWATIFLPLTCGNMLISGRMTSAIFDLAIILLVISTLLNVYGRRNATRSIFLAGTYIAIGSMFQQAFILFALALFPAIAEAKVGVVKEYAALILGYAAPYWIAYAFEIITPADFHPLKISTIFNTPLPQQFFVMLIGTGILMLTAVLLTLYNAIKLYAGNNRVRNCNNIVNYFGIAAALGIILDFANLQAYLAVFNLWAALQIANVFILQNPAKPRLLYRLALSAIAVFTIIMGICL